MIMRMKHKLKKADIDVLRKSEGKIATENLFMRDSRLGLMFIRYMLSNLKYLRKYEKDTMVYDSLLFDLENVLKTLQDVDKDFNDYVARKEKEKG